MEASLALDAIRHARQHTYYYRRLYESVPDDENFLEDLPITDPDEYWEMARTDLANVLTTPLAEGRIYCTGGSITTNDLRAAHLTMKETHDLSRVKAMVWGAILDLVQGERIASIASPTDLQVGFWDTINMYTGVMIPLQSVQILISNEQSTKNIAAAVERFCPSILIGSPSDLVRLTDHFTRSRTAIHLVRAVIYLGHTLPSDLHASWRGTFPKATLFPLLYAPTDLGLLGTPAPITTCDDSDLEPTYRAIYEIALFEIVADDSTVIKQPGVQGNVVVTHLARRLQPVIRYPIGDIAEWIDYAERSFRYRGRASIKIKLASTVLSFAFVKGIVDDALGTDVSGRCQCVLCCEGARPKLVVRLAYPVPHNPGQLRHDIERALWRTSPDWKRDRMAGAILSLRLDWVGADQLDRDEASGMLKEVVDER
ncbi:hypothetical protein GGR53DRAFT_503724 [Hypoxylon sp. FL1150]|nr:hypothetical protein GGR53DRAFT_503724 [Hypoxylon sp. FL1150]